MFWVQLFNLVSPPSNKMSFKSSGKPYARDSSSGGLPDGQWLHDKAPGGERTRTAPRASESAANNGPSAKLLVDNLHYEVSEKDLATLFGKYGSFAREPRIRFDKSGRSTGSAVVVYEEMGDAVAAKKGLDKQLAKGQELSIRFDNSPSGPRGGGGGRGGAASLLARLDSPRGTLASRVADADTPTGPKAQSGGVGPHRTRGGRGGGDRRGGGNSNRERPPRKKPVTAEDLDKELEQYGSKGDEGSAAPQAGPASSAASASAPAGDEDVEMA